MNPVGNRLLAHYVRTRQPKHAARVAKGLADENRALCAERNPLAFVNRLCHCAEYLALVGAFAEAEPSLREAQAVSDAQPPERLWRKYRTMSVRGSWLVAQGRYAEAEPLLLDGYAGIKAREATVLPENRYFVGEGADRLAELYTRWGRPAEAERWRAERAKYPRSLAPAPRPARK